MMFPVLEDCEKNPAPVNAEFLKGFRANCEMMAQEVTNRFGAHPEARMVIKKLIEARMWSGNLFGYCKVKDLNRERDEAVSDNK